MSSNLQKEYDIQRYNSLKEQIKIISQKLYTAIDNIDLLNNEVKTKYQINDDASLVSSRINSLRENIFGTYNYLINEVIPALDSATLNLQNKKD